MILLIVVVTTYIIIKTNNNNDTSKEIIENSISTEDEILNEKNIVDTNINAEEKKDEDENNKEENNMEEASSNNIKRIEESITTENKSLPDDTGLTVSGIPKTFNQDIIAKANISYLLGCENITETTNFDDYISKNLPKNGIFISNVTGYAKTNNPYDFVKNRTDIMKDMLKSINLAYDINKYNYLISNNGKSELEQRINKIISGNKKIIIGFVPEYYVYINDIDNGLQFGGYGISSYVSLKPYNNIYTFICDPDSITNDNFYSMIEEVCNLAE